MKKIKVLIIFFNIVFLLIAVELFFLYALDYKTLSKIDTCQRLYNNKKDFSYYSPNCEIITKHWEQKNFISYKINSEGRRDLSLQQNKNVKKIAFIGDSFTFGAMVPIQKNYNFYAFNTLRKSYEIHNYGTPAEQLHNVFNKLKTLDHKKYDYFVYGLTPNDFFDLVDGSYIKNFTKKNKSENINKVNIANTKLFYKLKNYLVSTATSRFILHTLMSNDQIYINTYLSRTPYSEYLSEELTKNWISAINFLDQSLKELDKNFKTKLKIFILPQRAEVVSMRLNKYNLTFLNTLINVCKKNEIDCSHSDVLALSKIKESHFPVDGHLTIEGNRVVAEYLFRWASKWN